MGSSFPGGTKVSSGSAKESSLAKTQGRILTQRESQFQQYFFPEIVAELEATKGNVRLGQNFQQAASVTNKGFNAAQTGMDRSFAQRGLRGTGIEAQGQMGLQAARGSALSNAFQRAQQATAQQRSQLFQIGGGFAPTPTTAAPTLAQNSSKGKEGFFGMLFG